MTRITQGRVIPDSDGERVAAELRKFNTEANEFLKMLTDAVVSHQNGWLRLHVQAEDGVLTKIYFQSDHTKDIRLDR